MQTKRITFSVIYNYALVSVELLRDSRFRICIHKKPDPYLFDAILIGIIDA